MDRRTKELDPVASSEPPLGLYVDDDDDVVVNNDNGTTSTTKRTRTRTRRRACPIVAILGLLVHMTACCGGVALSVLIVRFGLQVTSAGRRDLVARILLFVASCMGLVYVVMHIFASREKYVRSHQNGTPQIYGYFSVAVAILMMRLVIPVWIGAVVLTALVAAHTGFHISDGIQGNVVWVQLLLASVALVSLIVMIIVVETTDRPFATSIFSRKTFIRGMDNATGRTDTFEHSISRQGFRFGGNKKHRKGSAGGTTEPKMEQMGFDRSLLNTPESAEFFARSPQTDNNDNVNTPLHRDWPQRQTTLLRAGRVRSQPVPTPLEAIFSSDSIPPDARQLEDSPRESAAHFDWRPQTRDQAKAQQRQQQLKPKAASLRRRPSMPNLATNDPPSQPPNMPLPMMPAREGGSPETTTTSTTMIPFGPRPSASELRPSTAPQPDVRVSDPTDPPTLQPPPAQGQGQPETDPPSLANLLSQLSTRAAARHRNSLLVRQADLAPRRQSIDITRISSTSRGGDMATVLGSQQPGGDDDDAERIIEIPWPQTAPRGLLTDEGEPLALRAHPLVRSNTDTPRLVSNFSRPRVQVRKAIDDAEEGRGSSGAATRTGQQRDQMVRRSRSLPARADSGRPKNRNTLVEVGSQFEPKYDADMMPRGRRKGPADPVQVLDGQPPAVPRLSPFPWIPGSNRKIKGLGQGSAKWLDERVAQWRDGVNGQAHYREGEEELPNTKSFTRNPDPVVDAEGGTLRRWGSRLSRQNSTASRKTALMGTNF